MSSAETILASPIVTFLLSLVTFGLGILISYVLYRIQMRPYRLAWSAKSLRVTNKSLAQKIAGLKITYADQQVDDLILSRVVFWNCGLRAIKQGDLATGEPLLLDVGDDARVLSAELKQRTNKSNNITLNDSVTEKRYILFNDLERNDGAIIELLHDGGKVRLGGRINDGRVENKSLDTRMLDEKPNDPGTFLLSLPWIWAKQPYRRRIQLLVFSSLTFLMAYMLVFTFVGSDLVAPLLLPVVVVTRWMAAFMFLAMSLILSEIWRSGGLPASLCDYYKPLDKELTP